MYERQTIALLEALAIITELAADREGVRKAIERIKEALEKPRADRPAQGNGKKTQ